jgi:hypothetical protein
MRLTYKNITHQKYIFNYSNIRWNCMDIIILESHFHNSIIGHLSDNIFRSVHINVMMDVHSYMRT